jgi:hypothetical protein
MKLDDPDLLEKPSTLITPFFDRTTKKSLFCQRNCHERCLWQECTCACHYKLSQQLKHEESR